MYQAIITKWIAPTNRLGSRVKAIAEAGTVTMPWQGDLGVAGNHVAAAKALVTKFGWNGEYVGGGLPGGSGYAFVVMDKAPQFTVTT